HDAPQRSIRPSRCESERLSTRDSGLSAGSAKNPRPRVQSRKSKAGAIKQPMPELPEVEAVRRMLRPVMEGARFERVELRRPDLRAPFPRRFAARLQGQTVKALDRRGKYL